MPADANLRAAVELRQFDYTEQAAFSSISSLVVALAMQYSFAFSCMVAGMVVGLRVAEAVWKFDHKEPRRLVFLM